MPKKSILDLRYPIGGLHKSTAYQNQPPFTTPDCNNVRGSSNLSGRERGGQRPGLSKACYEQLGSGNPVRLVNEVSYLPSDLLTSWEDDFSGTSLGSEWSATGAWYVATAPSITTGELAGLGTTTKAGCVRSAVPLDSSSAYQIDIYIVPYQDAHHGTYSIFARMANSSPAATTEGIVAALTVTGSTGVYTGSLKSYVGGVATTTAFTGATTGTAKAGWFRVLISGTTVTCSWLGTTVATATVGAHTGIAMGFGMECTVTGGMCLVDGFRVQYRASGTQQPDTLQNILVASANGVLYKETYAGTMASVTTNLTLDSSRRLQSAEYLQKLYIADYAPARTKCDGNIVATDMDSGSIANWAALSIDAHDDMVQLYSGTGTVTDGMYTIATVAANSVTLGSAAGTGAASIRVMRGCKIYDPTAATLTLWNATAGKGSVPHGCKLLCRYRERMVLAAPWYAPHTFYMSRVGDPLDWLDTDTDDGRSIAGEAGQGALGSGLTAIVPHSDDYLLLAEQNLIHVCRGDPAMGGRIDTLSHAVGIVDASAWCHGINGEIFFLAPSGLHYIPSGANMYPIPLSEEKLPDELKGISNTRFDVALEFDIPNFGVHIYLVPIVSGGVVTHYFYDLKTKAFWPFSLPNVQQPTGLYRRKNGQMVLGGRDGYLREYRSTNEMDDGTAITSYVLYGPIRLGGNDYQDGMISELIGTLANGSGDVAWSVLVDETSEEAAAASAFATGTWATDSRQRQYTARPRARGGSFYLKLANSGNTSWEVESIVAIVNRLGRQRMA